MAGLGSVKKIFQMPHVHLMRGTFLVQIFGLLLTPIVARMYGPDVFGQLSIFLTFAAFFQNLSLFQTDKSIFTQPQNAPALAFPALLVFFVASVSVLLGLGFQRFDIGGFSYLSPYDFLLLFPIIFVSAFSRWSRSAQLKQGKYQLISKATWLSQLSSHILRLGLGLVSPQLLSLLAAEIGSLTLLVHRMKKGLVIPISWSLGRLRELLIQAKDFAVFGQASVLVNSLAALLPIQLIASTYGLREAGFFAVVYRFVTLPIQYYGQASGDVFLNVFSELSQKEERHRMVQELRKSFLINGLVGTCTYVVFAFFGAALFKLLFGEKFAEASPIVSALIPWCFGALVVSPLSHALIILKKQKMKMIYDFLFLFAIAWPFVFKTYFSFDLVEIVWAMSLGQLLNYLIYAFIIDRVVCSHYKHVPAKGAL